EGDRWGVVRGHAALRRQDQEWVAARLRGVPAQPGVLGQPEDVPGRPVAQEVRRQRQQAGWPVRRRLDVEEVALVQLYRPRSRTVSHAISISPGFASKIWPVERRT